MAKIIAVGSTKGGIGKSFVAEELGCCFSDMGYKVLCIDMDVQGDLTNNSGGTMKNTIMDVFEKQCKIRDGIQHLEYFDLIPADTRLSSLERIFTERDDIYLLADLCEIIETAYDYIIIDNPPSKSLAITMSYVAADYIISPTLADDNSLKGIVSIEQDVKKMREGRNQESHARILCMILNQYKQRTMAHIRAKRELDGLSEVLPGEVIVETIRESIKVTESRTMKQPMQRYDRFNNVSVDMRKIAKKVDEVIKHG